jgi:hypothetical protein
MPPYCRVTLAATNFSQEQGRAAAADLVEGFKHRPHHRNVTCEWNEGSLILHAENDDDDKGLALMDEFSDEISANVTQPPNGNIRIVSVVKIEPPESRLGFLEK